MPNQVCMGQTMMCGLGVANSSVVLPANRVQTDMPLHLQCIGRGVITSRIRAR
jgi:hypothetical protein